MNPNLLSIPQLVSWAQNPVKPEQCLRAGTQGMAHYLSATTRSAAGAPPTLAAQIIKRLRYRRSLINHGRTVVAAWQTWALEARLAQRKATRAALIATRFKLAGGCVSYLLSRARYKHTSLWHARLALASEAGLLQDALLL